MGRMVGGGTIIELKMETEVHGSEFKNGKWYPFKFELGIHQYHNISQTTT